MSSVVPSTMFLLALVPASAQFLATAQAAGAPEGSVCQQEAKDACAPGLVCGCLALNRGLHVCMPEATVAWIATTGKENERQGLSCEPALPDGVSVMDAPPVVDVQGVVDPRTQPALKAWATGAGRGAFQRYTVVRNEAGAGLPVLAGDDVPEATVAKAAAVAQHVLINATLYKEVLPTFAKYGMRLLLEGTNDMVKGWMRQPEVQREMDTGLGGGAPWFPSTGIMKQEEANTLAEELFHTMQYTVMQPHAVCMYHKAYRNAYDAKLYSSDSSGPEIGGEPVPTVQADEYLAMALQRWIGYGGGEDELFVKGNNADGTGREHLRVKDPNAFCVLSTVFRSDDTWNPEPNLPPWGQYPNKAMDLSEVASFCAPVLTKLGQGCPSESVTWPYLTEYPAKASVLAAVRHHKRSGKVEV